jgi:hexosaminidase
MGSQPERTGLDLVPWPRSVDRGTNSIALSSARIEPRWEDAGTDRLVGAFERLSEDIAALTGLPLDGPDPQVVQIRMGQVGTPHPGIGEDESYWLVADDAGVFVDAESEWGVLRALATILQLVTEQGMLPHIAITDRPRFCWRGLLLDPARHFLSVEALQRTLDGMAQCKMNVLHLHLSDDQGFRFPVAELPGLASSDAYTVAELEQLVAFASARGIRIVPEIDMPGHVTSWLVTYPEWGARQVPATDRFGVHGACLDPSNEEVYRAIELILDALVAVFPDPCLHIGGDEVSPRWWSEDPAVQALMEREGLEDVGAVQGYFNKRVGALVEARSRRVLAWDEVLNDQLPPDWIVQAWRGATSRNNALIRGNSVVVSAPYYLDLHFPADVHYRFDPAAPQETLIEFEDDLIQDPRFEHVAEGIAWTRQWREGAFEEEVALEGVLGGEACLWGELVSEDVLDVRLWTRLPALAERFWSDGSLRDNADLHERLDAFLDRIQPLRGRDLARWTEERLVGMGISGEWLTLVRMLEPVKWYGRLLGAEALEARIAGREMPQSRPYGVNTPLDGLIDFLPVESRAARDVAALCSRLGASEADDAAGRSLLSQARDWLALGAKAGEAPDALGVLAGNLGELGDLMIARLERDELADVDDVNRICRPVGELMVAMPPDLRQWLLSR